MVIEVNVVIPLFLITITGEWVPVHIDPLGDVTACTWASKVNEIALGSNPTKVVAPVAQLAGSNQLLNRVAFVPPPVHEVNIFP